MRGLNSVTHKMPHIQRKVNYFIDHFQFVLDKSGILPEFEIENCKSVVEKIIYQIEKNIDKCVVYIDNYLSKPYLKDISYLGSFTAFAACKVKLDEYTANPKKPEKKVAWIKSNPSFLQCLKSLHKELSRKMFGQSIDVVINLLACSHELEEHQAEIAFHTKIIVTELLFKKKSKAEVGSVISRIFTADFKKFPYPSRYKTDGQKKRFFESKDFRKSFKGIENFYKEEEQFSHIIFKIDGIIFPKGFSLKYNTALLMDKTDKRMRKLLTILEGKNKDWFTDWFTNDHYIFVAIPSTYHSLSIAHQESLKVLSDVVLYVNEILNSSVTYNKKNYLYTQNFATFGWNIGFVPPFRDLSKYDQSLLKENPYHLLRTINSRAKEKFIQNESIYLNARNQSNYSEYWRYIEVLLGTGQSKSLLAGILLLTEKEYRVTHIDRYLKDRLSPFTSAAKDLGITVEEQRQFLKTDFKLKDAAGKIISDFFNEAMAMYRKRFHRKTFRHSYAFNVAALTELYEQRNMIEHAGKINEYAGIKLRYSVDHIITRLRICIYRYIRKYPTASF